MKNAISLLIFFLLIACNSGSKQGNYLNNNPSLSAILGFYEYEANRGGNNQFILIDTLNNKLYGIYYLAEARRGKGQEYYANSLSRFKLAGDSISFTLDARKLFNSKPVSPGKRSTNMPVQSGITSARELNFRGVYSNEILRLNCISENGNCPYDEMTFRKIPLPE